MLPDGAEKQPEDWTIFFLNQTPFNTIAPVLALETPDANERRSVDTDLDGDGTDEWQPDLLYVLNLVRTKLDKTARRCAYLCPTIHVFLTRASRGAFVKAMAICTRHPFIQIFKACMRANTPVQVYNY